MNVDFALNLTSTDSFCILFAIAKSFLTSIYQNQGFHRKAWLHSFPPAKPPNPHSLKAKASQSGIHHEGDARVWVMGSNLQTIVMWPPSFVDVVKSM